MLRMILARPLRLGRADHGRQLAAAGCDRSASGPTTAPGTTSIFDRLNIRRTCTEHARRGTGEDDARLQYSLEWAFFTRCQWGEFDTALYELEHCWGRQPEPPSPIGGAAAGQRSRDPLAWTTFTRPSRITSTRSPTIELISTATGIFHRDRLPRVSDEEMAAALRRRDQAGPAERDIYASYINEAFLTALEKHAGRIVFQFSLGAEPHALRNRRASCGSGRSTRLREMIGRHPRLRFQVFLAIAARQSGLLHAGPRAAQPEPGRLLVAQLLPRQHAPGHRRAARHAAGRTSKSASSPTPIAWSGCTAKRGWCEKQLARVLAEKIQQGQYTRDDAVAIARASFTIRRRARWG